MSIVGTLTKDMVMLLILDCTSVPLSNVDSPLASVEKTEQTAEESKILQMTFLLTSTKLSMKPDEVYVLEGCPIPSWPWFWQYLPDI